MSRYRARHRRSNRSWVLSALLAIVLIITTMPGTAQAAPKLTSETIQGHVTGLDAGGNTVAVDDVPVLAQSTAGGDYYSAETDSDGSYSIDVPDAGDYNLQTNCPESSTCGQTWADAYYDDQNSFGDQDTLTVTAGTPATADFHLQRFATITGTIVDSAGHPASEVTVENAPWGGGNVISDVTGADGVYTLNRVVPGRNSLRFTDDTGAYRFQNAAWDGTRTVPYQTQPVIIAPGPTVTTADINLKPWSGLLVTAKDAAGHPLKNIGYNVQTLNPRTGHWEGPQLGPLLTDANGRFAWASSVGKTVRFCLSDNYYERSYQPKYRYNSKCWQNKTEIQNATPITFTNPHPKFSATLTLSRAGLSMRPVQPFVTGTPATGQPLSVDTGTWTPAGVTFSYQWAYLDMTQDVFVPIAGATAATFNPTADLQGQLVVAEVTGSASGYASATLNGYAGRIGAKTPSMSPALRIAGTPTVGSTVRGVPGTLSPRGASIYYQWLVGGVPYGQEQSGTAKLKLTSAMQGKIVSLRAQVYASGYPNSLQQLAQTGPVS